MSGYCNLVAACYAKISGLVLRGILVLLSQEGEG